MSRIQTTECDTFWRRGLRCRRMTWDMGKREDNVVWIVGGVHGVATLLIVHDVHALRLTFSAVLADGRRYEPWLLSRHTLEPIHEDDTRTDSCEYLENMPCYVDSSGIAACMIFEAAVEADDEEVIWMALETYYRGVIENATKVQGTLEGPEHEIDIERLPPDG